MQLQLLTGWEPVPSGHDRIQDPGLARTLLGRAFHDRLELGALREMAARSSPGVDVSRLGTTRSSSS